MRLRGVLIIQLLLFSGPLWADAASLSVSIGDTDIPVERYQGQQAAVALLWIPGETPYGEARTSLAVGLAGAGFDVWYADLFSARFLPPGASSLNSLEPDLVSRLIDHVARVSGKPVMLFSNDHGAGLTLRAAADYRAHAATPGALLGALLISPSLLVRTPAAGHDPDYQPIIDQPNVPLYLIVPRLSVGYLRAGAMQARLAEAGTAAYTQTIGNARDRFFFRPDSSAVEHAAAKNLPAMLARAAALLQATPTPQNTTPRLRKAAAPAATETKILSQQLIPYEGSIANPEFSLTDLDGNTQRLSDYRGAVILVNFWASWCPPCVHEIPSMQRLQQKLAGHPFKILAINMAEAPDTVRAFMQRMQADFSVLLDLDNRTTLAWKVQAFPTSFLLDKNGTIRYGVFGAVEWEDEQVVSRIEALMREKK